MAKGDYVIVKSEIGGLLVTEEVKVTGAGGSVEVEWDKKAPLVTIRVLGRTGKTRRALTFATSAIRSLEEVRRDDD